MKDKANKIPFKPELHIAAAIQEKGTCLHKAPHDEETLTCVTGWRDPKYGIYVYYGTGSAADGLSGDHIMVAPPYTVTKEKLEWFVDRLERLLIDFFAELEVQLAEK